MTRTSWIAAVLLLHVLVADRLHAVQFTPAQAQVRISETSFDKSNFGQLSLIAARNQAEDSLQTYLRLIDEAASLTAEQREKLELAGRIDIHRFFTEYENLKRPVNFGLTTIEEWRQTVPALQKSVQPLAARFASGLHDDSSLLAKTLVTTLQPAQQQKVDKLLEDRKRLRYEHQIRIALAMLDFQIPLTQSERTKIKTWLLTKTQPPDHYSASVPISVQILIQMAQIEDDLQELLAEEEAAAMRILIRAAKRSVASK